MIGHEVVLLAKSGVAGERMRVGLEAGAAGEALAQADHSAPFGEPRAHIEIVAEGAPAGRRDLR